VVTFRLEPIDETDFDFRFGVYKATIKPYLDRMFDWSEAEEEAFVRSNLTQTNNHAAIVVAGKRAGIVQIEETADRISLHQIEILPTFQGQGIGGAVVRSLIDRAEVTGKPVHLSVFHANTGARRLYERLGFTVVADTERDAGMVYTPCQTTFRD
jgi:ribosomal protein S18 acetylase RimI-like enzyme